MLEAYVAASVAMVIFGIPAALQQHRYSPIAKDAPRGIRIEWVRVAIVALILVVAILANVIANLRFPALLDAIPVIGLAVWAVILVTAPLRKPDWEVMPATFKGTIFLLALVTAASMMPVEKLPLASWQTALGLGFVSAVFDNIPLTALALNQGGYDWAFLAYAVGFGGSMIWFGSSAGVALANMYPEAKSVGLWLAPRLARRGRLRDRLLRHARAARLEAGRRSQEARRSAADDDRAGREDALTAVQTTRMVRWTNSCRSPKRSPSL